MDNLKQCPFCGGEAELESGLSGQAAGFVPLYQAECLTCGVASPDWETDSRDAIAAWNTRADDAELDRLRAENERLRGWLDSVKPKPFGFGIGDTNVVGVQKTLPKYLTGGQP